MTDRTHHPRSGTALAVGLIMLTAAVGGIANRAIPPAGAINNGSTSSLRPYVAFTHASNGVSCSGTLISPVWVLTAGHCVDAMHPWQHTVQMGTTNRATLRNYPVAGARRYPGWPTVAGSFDVALLRLAKPVTDITPAALGTPADHGRIDGPNDLVRAVGWGLTACGGLDAKGNCKSPVTTSVMKTKEGRLPAAGDILSATFTNGGPCAGDSGSPLLVSSFTGHPVVVGALSQAGCENGSNSYVNVAEGPAHDWIVSVLDSGPIALTERPWTADAAPVNSRQCFDAGSRDYAPEPINLIPGRPAYRTSWWIYDPGPGKHRFQVTTDGSAVDTVVAVFQTTGDTLQYDMLTRRLSNDDSGGTDQSSVVGTEVYTTDGAQSGTEYAIAVGTYSQATTGLICVQLLDAAPPTTNTGGDILWYNSQTHETQAWYMAGNRLQSRGTVLNEYGQPIFIGPPYQIVGSNDYNGDGKADILWYNSQTGETQIWFMALHFLMGRGTVIDSNGNAILIGPPFRIVGTGDFNGDHYADILWYNSETHETQIWYMRRNVLMSRATVLGLDGNPVFIGPPYSIVSASDLNSDGKSDILWYNSQTGETQMWFMNQNRLVDRGTVVDDHGNAILIGPPYRIVATGDYNADRRGDILWYNSQTGETQMWFMNRNVLAGRATVLGLNGNPVFIGPPFSIVGSGVFNPLS